MFGGAAARRLVESAWRRLLDIFPRIELDEFVVMPDHVHFVVWIAEGETLAAAIRPPRARRRAPLPLATSLVP